MILAGGECCHTQAGRSGRAAIHGRFRLELTSDGLKPPQALKGKSFDTHTRL